MKRASAIGLALLLSACGTTRIQERVEHPLPAAAAAELPAAIAAGARETGWSLRPLRPGQIEATRTEGGRMARLDILYDDKGYRLRYRDSSGMAFDGRHIDPAYNRWIQTLDQAIADRLAGAAKPAN